jgi:predicted transporter
MDLNLVLWMGGMLFSLSIFVIKVGFGLGWGQLRWKGIFLTLVLYLGIFVLTAMLSASLIKNLGAVVRQGPYLHAFMALGMMAWGIYVIRKLPGQSPACRVQSNPQEHKAKAKDSARLMHHSTLFLLLPCPVCLTAITFSTWAALQVIKLPASVVGLGLGIIFIILSLLVFLFVRIFTLRSAHLNKRIALGLSMIGIGLYFLTSLIIPAHIEAAKAIYQSFVTEGSNIALSDHLGVFLLLLGAILVGFFTTKNREVSE